MSLLFPIVAAVASLVVAAPTNIPDDGIHLSVRAPLRFQTVGNSGVSAQQMFLGTANKVNASGMLLCGCSLSSGVDN